MQPSRRRGAVAVTVALFATVLANATPVGGQVVPTCNGLDATIIGTEGRDNLRGTPGDDVIVGLGGPDRIVGLGGDDTICGGTGRDLIRGNNGRDTIFGEGGRDRIYGGGGRDTIHGMGGNDLVYGGNGADQIDGGIGENRTDGGPSDDICKDNLFVRNCERLLGVVSVETGFDGTARWTHDPRQGPRRFAFSDDGRYAVFTGHRDGNIRRVDVVLRDMVDDTFTVVGRSRTNGSPFIAGVDISGDGSTIAFSSSADGLVEGPDTTGIRLYLVDRETGATEQMPIPDGFDLNGIYRPKLSTDGSIVTYELIDADLRANPLGSTSVVRQLRDGSLEVLNAAADGGLFEARSLVMSGDGSTVAFGSEQHDLPGQHNGRYADPIVWQDGARFLAYPDLIRRRSSGFPSGLNHDGSVLVGTIGRTDEFYDNRAVFFNTQTRESTTVRADSFCADCWFNGLAYEGTWVAASLLWDRDDAPSDRRGLALFTADGRSDIVFEDEDLLLTGISPDGGVVGTLLFTDRPYRLLYRNVG